MYYFAKKKKKKTTFTLYLHHLQNLPDVSSFSTEFPSCYEQGTFVSPIQNLFNVCTITQTHSQHHPLRCIMYYRGKMKCEQRSAWLAVQAAPPGSEPRGEGALPLRRVHALRSALPKFRQGASKGPYAHSRLSAVRSVAASGRVALRRPLAPNLYAQLR